MICKNEYENTEGEKQMKKRILSLLLVLVMAIGFLPTVASAGGVLTEIKSDVVTNITWNSDTPEKVVYLTVDETGYYDLTVKDNNETASFYLYVEDLDEDPTDISLVGEFDFSLDEEEGEFKNIYLKEGHLYEIIMYYENYYEYGSGDYYYPCDADIDICFKKTDYQPTEITLGQNQNIFFENGYTWFSFKTTLGGDYQFKSTTYLNASLAIFEKNTGKLVEITYINNILLFPLKANTDFVICAMPYGDSSSKFVRLQINKTSADMTRIDIVQNNTTILAHNAYFYDDSAELYYWMVENFKYKVTYSNNTTETLSYYELGNKGYSIDEIEYIGDIYTYKDEELLKSGVQPVVIKSYRSPATFNSSIYVNSYVEYVSNLTVATDYDTLTIEYEDYEEKTYYWSIKPDTNNSYQFYSSNWDQIYSDIVIYDKNNNIVAMTDGGWNLKAGERYCLKITYTYKSNCYYDVHFSLQPYREHSHSFGNYVYNNDATTLTDGTKTRTCSTCAYKETVTAVGTKLVTIVDTTKIFSDVAQDWYTTYVNYAYSHNIFKGNEDGTFKPLANITRAEFVQVLANITNVNTSNKAVTTKFYDVKSGDWFAPAVKWANDNGIVAGYGAEFKPQNNITREQMCVMIVNYAKYRGISLKIVEAKEAFADDWAISSWAKDAVYACQMADIVNGKGAGRFDPAGTGLRAEASVIFTKFHQSYLK